MPASTSTQNYNSNSTTSLRGNTVLTVQLQGLPMVWLLSHLLICCLLNKGTISFSTFAIHYASAVYAGVEVWKQETLCLFKFIKLLRKGYLASQDLYLLGTYHCVFYLCCPKPVPTDVNDIIHAPCYLVIAFLGPVSTIPCEVIT